MIEALTREGLGLRLNAQGGLEVEGLATFSQTRADELRRFIRERREQIKEEVATRAIVAAHELIDLAGDGRIMLAWTDNGPAWAIPLEHEAWDRDWIQGLIDEALMDEETFRRKLKTKAPGLLQQAEGKG